MINLIKSALNYIGHGISVIPTNSNKRSIFPWKEYQSALMKTAEVNRLFSDPRCEGIATICGAVSGNMECIDLDLKNDITTVLLHDFMLAITEAGLSEKLLIVETKNKGRHFIYRCLKICGNTKIASRYATPDEIKSNPNVTTLCTIESRGEAGYIIASPTPGYNIISGKLQEITPQERETLWDICRSFNEVIAEPERPKVTIDRKQYGLSPFEDYNMRGDCEQVLINNGWRFLYERRGKRHYRRPGKDEGASGDYWPEKKWFSVFTTSSQFVANKAYNPTGVFTLLECNNDFSIAAKKLLDMGYGEKRVNYGSMEREVFKRKNEGANRDEIKNYIQKKYSIKDEDEAESALSAMEQQWGDNICTFWDIDKNKKPNISRYKLKVFLSEVGGFGLYFYDRNSNIFKIVQEENGLVQEASTEQIKRFIENYVLGLPECFDGGITQEELLEVIYRGSETYFSKSFLEFLDRKEIDFLKDTSGEAFFPFKNGVIVVSGNGIKLKSYADLKKSIWRSQIIDFDIDILKTVDIEDAEFCTFIQKIANDDQDRIKQAITLIGYTLHKYKDETKPYALILAEETEDEAKGGGTGKGLFFKAISKLINVVFIDGKTMDLNKSFAWQRVGLDTQLIVIEDCRKNVDFEGFYSKITEGLTVEKKNKDEIYLPYEDAPKFGFTTNYSITLKGNHGKRRGKVIEFSDFFHPGHTPEDVFKHKLFSGWDRDEWNRFYNFMFYCVSLYMLSGVHEVSNSDTLKRKQVKINYGEEFMEWWDHYCGNGCANWKQLKELHSNFLNESDQDKKTFSQKRFKKGLTETSQNFGLKIETSRDQQNAGATIVRVIK